MGLFDRGSGNERADRLSNDAHGGSVTTRKLLNNRRNPMMNYLSEESLLDHLYEDEQPHFIFHNDSKGIIKDGTKISRSFDSNFSSLLVITDKRVLFFDGGEDGDRGEALSYYAIDEAEVDSGLTKYKMTVKTSDNTYEFYTSKNYDLDELKDAKSYLQKNRDIKGDNDNSPNVGRIGDLPTLKESLDDDHPDISFAENRIGTLLLGEEQHKKQMVDDSGNEPNVFADVTVEDYHGVELSESTSKFYLYDSKILIKTDLPEHEIEIPTEEIDFDQIQIWTREDYEGRTQHGAFRSLGKSHGQDFHSLAERYMLKIPFGDDCFVTISKSSDSDYYSGKPGDIIRGLREVGDVKIDRSEATPDSDNSATTEKQDEPTPDRLEQLEKLKDLNEKGVISDSEFEEKKQDILDEI